MVVLPENFAFMPENDMSFVTNAEVEGSGPIQEFIAENAENIKFGL